MTTEKQKKLPHTKSKALPLILKIIFAGLLAFAALNLVFVLYSSIPSKAESPDHITDNIWKPNVFYSQLTEGFGLGKIDKNGYWNSPKLTENNNPDVLIIGSSQAEGLPLMQDKNMTYLLNTALSDLNLSAYSVGMSGNFLMTSLKNLENSLAIKQPKYAAIETFSVTVSDSDVEAVINAEFGDVAYFSADGLVDTISHFPYFRALYKQIKNLNEGKDVGFLVGNYKDVPADSFVDGDAHASLQQLNALMAKVSDVASENGTTPIIFYHPGLQLNADGSVTPQTDETDLKKFSAACEANDVIFLDLTPRFLQEYEINHIMPRGFFNTQIGSGHLNGDGHRMVAEELSLVIRTLEGGR